MRRIGCLVLRRGEAAPLTPEAQRALLEVALAHSPRVEEAGPGLVYLDLTGLRGLLGEEPRIGQRLRDRAAGRGLRVSVGIGGSRASARLAARWGDGVKVVAAGEDASALAAAPVSLLECAPDMAALLRRWGLRTLGELAALPAASLFERLGPEGLRLHELARGLDPRPLASWTPPRVLEESAELDWEVTELAPLAEIVAGLLERISVRLAGEELEADRLEWSLRLADRTLHEGALSPAVPTREPGALSALVVGALEARRPPAAVTAATLRAHPIRVPRVQPSLTDPPRPSARALAQTLSRIAALVGVGRVGVPALLDSHRPDAVALVSLPLPRGEGVVTRPAGRGLALRRLRPPERAAVRLTGGRPVHLRAGRLAGPVVISVGPWRVSGEWWLESRWLSDEWDAELGDGTLCRLAHDGSSWFLEGVYD